MAKRGRKPQAPKQPTGVSKAPGCPSWLGADGKRWWKAITKHMLARQTILPEHREIIAIVCESAELYHQAIRTIKKEGITATGGNGNVYQHPAVGIRNTAWKQVREGLSDLGLTPVSFKNVPAFGDKDSDDPLSEFLGDGGPVAGKIGGVA